MDTNYDISLIEGITSCLIAAGMDETNVPQQLRPAMQAVADSLGKSVTSVDFFALRDMDEVDMILGRAGI